MKTEEQRLHWGQKYQEEMASLTKPDPFFLSAYKQFVEDSFPACDGIPMRDLLRPAPTR